MNGKKAKECRREIYGRAGRVDYIAWRTAHDRKYFYSSVALTLPKWSRKIVLWVSKIPMVGRRLAGLLAKRIVVAVPSGSIIADPKRRAYQNLKKEYLSSKRG